ncbi:MAG: hypothetical protein NTV68_01225 [Methanomicrobiales archaeon]|nr:hypothetical protein [Methanomicrobiales archaeon]
MPPIEISRAKQNEVILKPLKAKHAEDGEKGMRKLAPASERFYGILKISDLALIEEIAERDQFD